MSTRGYEINMRQDRRTGEHLAVIPSAYDQGKGRYYMAYTLADGWVELAPQYVTRHTATAKTYPEDLKRAVDRNLGYILIAVPRLRG